MIPAFYPVLDISLLAKRRFPTIAAAEAILDAGARILQFRHKEFFSRAAFEDAERIATLCRSAGALFVVNDRADFAMLLDGALHLGQDDLAPGDARRIMPPGRVIGLSTHNAEQLTAGDREAVDYLAIGPIFSTASKQNPDPIVGVSQLSKLRELTRKPLIAIGGITRETAPLVLHTGVDAVAIIGDLYPENLTAASLRARAEEWLAICSLRT